MYRSKNPPNYSITRVDHALQARSEKLCTLFLKAGSNVVASAAILM